MVSKETIEQRVMKVMQHCIDTHQAGSKREFCANIGLSDTNLSNIRKGILRVTTDQLQRLCTVYNVSGDYLLGVSPKMFRVNVVSSPVERIKEALAEIESSL